MAVFQAATMHLLLSALPRNGGIAQIPVAASTDQIELRDMQLKTNHFLRAAVL